MWLTNSSIGRKYVMALTGACLILFVTFHVLMNAVCIFWPVAYNVICEFLGANWYALIASCGLALLFILHIIYATWLTVQNRKARGTVRYEVNERPKQVEWSSKNMLVLGIVILAFLVVHIIQFWSKMQWAEIIGNYHVENINGASVPVPPAAGTWMIEIAFSSVATPIIYIIGFIALWFHMNHGFWSMFQTAGWNNNVWLPRLKKIGCWWTTAVVGLFIAQAIVFTVQAHRHAYTTCPELQAQYADMIATGHDAGFAAPAAADACCLEEAAEAADCDLPCCATPAPNGGAPVPPPPAGQAPAPNGAPVPPPPAPNAPAPGLNGAPVPPPPTPEAPVNMDGAPVPPPGEPAPALQPEVEPAQPVPAGVEESNND